MVPRVASRHQGLRLVAAVRRVSDSRPGTRLRPQIPRCRTHTRIRVQSWTSGPHGCSSLDGIMCPPSPSTSSRRGLPSITMNAKSSAQSAHLSQQRAWHLVLVAHSMGGLAARHWFSLQDDPARIQHLITLGSPHLGTWLARFAIGDNGRQMRPGSDFLSALFAAETAQHRRRTSCFFSNCDNIVFPATNATLAGAENRHLTGCAHVQLIEHPDCWSALMNLLFTERRGSQRPERPDPS